MRLGGRGGPGAGREAPFREPGRAARLSVLRVGHHAQRRALPPELLQGERRRPGARGQRWAASGHAWGAEPARTAAPRADRWAPGWVGAPRALPANFPSADRETGSVAAQTAEKERCSLEAGWTAAPRATLGEGDRPVPGLPRTCSLSARRAPGSLGPSA